MTTLAATPTTLDLSVYAGDGFELLIEFVDGAELPVAMVGPWAAQIRATADADTELAAFTIDADAETDGRLVLSLTGAQTAALTMPAVWDLEQRTAGTEPRTWYRGRVLVTGDVTR